MKRNTLTSLALLVIVALMGACGNNAWDELPSDVANFVNMYFNGEVQSYTENDSGSVVKLRNSATLTFDSNGQWTCVDGNGVPLPQQFLFDRLPSPLYRYIESVEQTLDVMKVQRTTVGYKVWFADSAINYDNVTETISYFSGSAPGAG